MRQREIPRPGEFFRHFKKKYYQIIAIALHSETREQMVVYQALYDDFGVYVRPLDMFMSEVDKEKYPYAIQTYRFERVDRPCVSVESLERVGKKDENSSKKEESVIQVTPLVNEKTEHIDIAEDEYVMDPEVERFLDADTYKEKLNILMSLRSHITEKQLHDMAITLDVVIDDGDVDVKFMNLVQSLRTMARFEISR